MHALNGSHQTWLKTYKPLLIIGVFILGVSFITSKDRLNPGMNHFMVGFYLVFRS